MSRRARSPSHETRTSRLLSGCLLHEPLVGIFDADPGLDSRLPDAVGEQPSGSRQRQAGQLIGCPSDNVRGATTVAGSRDWSAQVSRSARESCCQMIEARFKQ